MNRTARIRRLLLALAAAFMLAAALSVGALWLPLDDLRPPLSAQPARAPATTQPASLPSPESFARAIAAPTRNPLFPPAPPPAVQPKPAPVAPASPALRLVGTAIDTAESVGVFVNSAGAFEVKRVGEKAGDAEVIEISARSAKLRQGGRIVLLLLSEAPTQTIAPWSPLLAKPGEPAAELPADIRARNEARGRQAKEPLDDLEPEDDLDDDLEPENPGQAR